MLVDQIVSELLMHAVPARAEHAKHFFRTGPGEYGEGDKFLGIKVPELRKIAKKYRFIEFDQVQKLLQNEFHEIRLMAVMLLVYRIEKADQDVIDEVAHFYLNNLQYVNNWDLVDSSCRFILAKFLENKDRELLYDLARSSNLWEKRISIITCYYFIKNGDFKDALTLSDMLLNDDHDLIQKAVGWMIREIGNKDFETELAFLTEGDRYKKMPRTMLRYAIEKFDEPLRKQFLNGKI